MTTNERKEHPPKAAIPPQPERYVKFRSLPTLYPAFTYSQLYRILKLPGSELRDITIKIGKTYYVQMDDFEHWVNSLKGR